MATACRATAASPSVTKTSTTARWKAWPMRASRSAPCSFTPRAARGCRTASIERESPDSCMATLGGQTGLKLSLAQDDTCMHERYVVQVLGTQLQAIRDAEDREAFKGVLQRLGEPVPDSRTVNTVADAR